MDWKLLILLAAALHCQLNAVADTIPMDYSQCCPEDADPSEPVQQVQPAAVYAELAACGESCRRARTSAGQLGRKPIRPAAVHKKLIRNKRFPIHLDPLYQYRFLARSGQCPTAKDGQPEYYCPTPDKMGNWRCIDDFQLCDGVRHCPNGEDELPVSCLFFRVVETHLNSVSQRLTSDEARREQQQQLQQQLQQHQQHQTQQRPQQKKGPR